MRRQILMVLSLAFSLAIFGCNEAGPTAGPPVTDRERVGTAPVTTQPVAREPLGDEAGVTVADITGNPTRYIGQTVTVRSEVEAAYGANAFRLDDDAVFEGGIDDDLLVIVPPKANLAPVNRDWFEQQAIVTGTVRNFVVAEIERDYGIDLGNEVEAQFNNKPVLIASSIRRVGDAGL